jgi:DnaJ-class molecular chaperone
MAMTNVTAHGVSLSLSYVMAGHKVRTMPDGRIAVATDTARDADQAERQLTEKLPVGYVVIRKGEHLLHVVKREPVRVTCEACAGFGRFDDWERPLDEAPTCQECGGHQRETCQQCKGRGERMPRGAGMGHALMGECADCHGNGWRERAKEEVA